MLEKQQTNFDKLAVVAAQGFGIKERVSEALSGITDRFNTYSPSRRLALRGVAVLTAGSALGVSNASELARAMFRTGQLSTAEAAHAQEAVVSWQVSENIGCGDEEEISNRGFSTVNLKALSDQVAVFSTGHVSFEGTNNQQAILYGASRQPNGEIENRGSLVVVYGGTPDQSRDYCTSGGIEVKTYVGPDGEVKAGWYGTTPYPSFARSYSEFEQHLLRERNQALRDPNSGNGRNGNGVEFVDAMVIYGPTGQLVKVLEIDRDNNITVKFSETAPDHRVEGGSQPQGQPQPNENQPVVEPTVPENTGTTQPGFVGEQEVTPAEVNIPVSIQAGVPTRIEAGSIIRGEIGHRNPQTGQFEYRYDSNPNSGVVNIITEGTDIMAIYGASGIEKVGGDIRAMAEAIAAEMRANGCDSDGCGDGVFINQLPYGPFQK